jgi:hypothetical protein
VVAAARAVEGDRTLRASAPKPIGWKMMATLPWAPSQSTCSLSSPQHPRLLAQRQRHPDRAEDRQGQRRLVLVAQPLVDTPEGTSALLG